MNLSKRFLSVVFLFTLFTFCTINTQAQSASPATESPQRQADSHKDPQPSDDVELLKAKVNQLEKLVEEQQRLLALMEKRLSGVEEKNSSINETKVIQVEKTQATDAKLAVVKTAEATASTTTQTTPPTEAKVIAGWGKDHAFVQSADGSFTANLIGFAHVDFRGYQSGNHPPDTFLLRRARLGVEGKLAKYFEYRLLGDFADTRSTPLRDAYVTIHRVNKFQVRLGQFKEPFGQEELSPVTSVDFVERSMVDNLVPSRSPGIMAFGVFNQGTFEYYAGAFNGKGILATNNNDTPEGVIRLRFAPFKNKNGSAFKNFAFGGAYAQGRNENGLSITGATESRSFIFYEPEPVNGKITRANGELSWTISQAQIRAEYDQVNQERENLGLGQTHLPGIVAKGFVGQFTYLLTGEHKGDGTAVDPLRPFFNGGESAFGAWELKARFARLQIADGTAKSNHAETIYFGANWYMNRFLKYLFDVGIERFNDPLRSPNPKDKNYLVILNRLQFTF